MKKTVLSLALAMVFGVTATANTYTEEEKVPVKAAESTITWKGYKVTGEHAGTMALKSGHLVMDGKKLTGGEFVVDMNSLTVTDLKAGEGKEKLEGHLKSDDFFGVANHPEAKLVITSAESFGKNSYTVQGDLTIKDITKPVTFVISMFQDKATASIKIDRSKFNVRYGSGSFFDNLGDKTIYDEFDLVVDLAL
ncbi:YceI family protein [Maribacter sp. 2307ULW6-5]|uniref:YceI family protein n=1 Tax=Maribacter sp. 2307ULW6-5 TaxID=3386275 RepID=UPI0039BD70D1